MNDLGILLCNCKKPAQLFFSKQKRSPFVGCEQYPKRRGPKCNYFFDLMENENLHLLNLKKGEKLKE